MGSPEGSVIFLSALGRSNRQQCGGHVAPWSPRRSNFELTSAGGPCAMSRPMLNRVLFALASIACGACSSAPAEKGVTAASLNVLHGFFCETTTHACRLPERITLLFQWIEKSGCPDVVALQEVSTEVEALVRARARAGCPFAYETAYTVRSYSDDQLVLSRYPVQAMEIIPLHRGYRTVLWTRIDHPAGPLDVFTTHLASSSDDATEPCGDDCPSECSAASAPTVRACQAVQLARIAEDRRERSGYGIVTGDLNEEPSSFAYAQMSARRWIDTYIAAGNPECDPRTGVGCTSGRAGEDLTELESHEPNVDERIDYIFAIPPENGACRIDSGSDADGDGVATKVFAGEPNPFAESCGAAPKPICWPSDHEGVQADIDCG